MKQAPLFSFAIPEGTKASSCSACGQEIYFVRSTKTDRYMPLNSNGSSHFSDCPKAAQFRKPKGKR